MEAKAAALSTALSSVPLCKTLFASRPSYGAVKGKHHLLHNAFLFRMVFLWDAFLPEPPLALVYWVRCVEPGAVARGWPSVRGI
jgi:hypothetical protein